MPEARRLPELARSLRTLGRSGDSCSEDAHTAIFTPLLAARARAEELPAERMHEAFVGHVLLARIEERVAELASRGIAVPARGRAMSARAHESIEPVRRQLLALDDASTTDLVAEEAWSTWVAQLRDVFIAADQSCRALAVVLADRPQGAPRVGRRLA